MKRCGEYGLSQVSCDGACAESSVNVIDAVNSDFDTYPKSETQLQIILEGWHIYCERSTTIDISFWHPSVGVGRRRPGGIRIKTGSVRDIWIWRRRENDIGVHR